MVFFTDTMPALGAPEYNSLEMRPEGEVNSVSVEWTAGKVTLKPYIGKSIYILQTSNGEITEEYNVKPEIKGGILTIPDVYKSGTGTVNQEFSIEISVPQGWMEKMETIEIKTDSADIKVRGFKTQVLKLTTISGEADVEKASSLKSTEITTDSGEIEVGDFESPSAVLKSTSGDIEYKSVTEEIKTESKSGEVEIENLNEFKLISVKTASGEVELKLAEGLSAVDFTSKSGSTDFAVSKDSKVKVETESGDLKVKLKKHKTDIER